MKNLLIALMSLSFLSVSLYASDSEGYYAGGYGGANVQSINKHTPIKTDTGFSGGLFSGYKFCNNIRVEGELAYRQNRWNFKLPNETNSSFIVRKKFNLQTVSLMANALYDFDLHPQWTPYLGGGIGYARLFSSDHYSDNKVALQAIAGISYSVCPKTDLGLEYRFFRTGIGADDNTFVVSLKQFF